MPVRFPRPAWPFTTLTGPDTVSLVAGEDFRYTLTGPGLETWLPEWLAGLDGRTPLDEALGRLPAARRASASQVADRLYGERFLVNGTAADVHRPQAYHLAVKGNAWWAPDTPTGDDGPTLRPLPAFCQDTLDYAAALRFNRQCLDAGTPWLWATVGPMSRAYVGPLFLPDAGPCLGCLLGHFRRVSPAPDLYDALTAHAHAGGPMAPAPFPAPAVGIVRQLLAWKAELAAAPEATAALYRLHVVEVADLEVTSHRVWIDPECPECGGRP